MDFLSASAHKFNGPKGIVFFIRKRAEIGPHVDSGYKKMYIEREQKT